MNFPEDAISNSHVIEVLSSVIAPETFHVLAAKEGTGEVYSVTIKALVENARQMEDVIELIQQMNLPGMIMTEINLRLEAEDIHGQIVTEVTSQLQGVDLQAMVEAVLSGNYVQSVNGQTGVVTIDVDSAVTAGITAQVPTMISTAISSTVPGMVPTKASEAEAEAGTDDTKFMTPLRTKEVVDATVSTAIDENVPIIKTFFGGWSPGEAVCSVIKSVGVASVVPDDPYGPQHFTVTFTSAMPDANYAVIFSQANVWGLDYEQQLAYRTTTSFRFHVRDATSDPMVAHHAPFSFHMLVVG